MKNNVSTSADAANSGTLKLEKEWKQWEEKFINYTRLYISANGVLLSYVICENEDSDMDTEYLDFINKTIRYALLTGEHYNADRLAVFNMIISFATSQLSGD